jgi:hypothetical protein
MNHFLDYRSQHGEDFIYRCAKEMVRNDKEEMPEYDAEKSPLMHGLVESLKKDGFEASRYSAERLVSMVAINMWLKLLDAVEVLPK